MATKSPVEAVVYRARNLVNGKSYIGYTRNSLRRRMGDHVLHARRGKGFALHAAMRKYGVENFIFGVIAEFEDVDLAALYEYEIIDKEKPAYNLIEGGVNTRRSAWSTGNTNNYWKGKVGSRLGSVPTAETRALMRHAKLGKPSASKGRPRPHTAEKLRAAAKKRAVRCIDTGQVFSTMREAAAFYEAKAQGNLSTAIRHGWRFMGHYFEYLT